MHPLDHLLRRALPAAVLGAGAAALAVGWFTQPPDLAKGYAPAQPIPFSHEQHAGQLGIPCGYCHSGARRSPVAGIPGPDLCMGCHRVTRTDSPSIQAVARASERGDPLPWIRIHALPDHVAFDHRPHVRAGFACQDCHRAMEAQTAAERRMNMRMGACLDCHRHPPGGRRRGPDHCTACHR